MTEHADQNIIHRELDTDGEKLADVIKAPEAVHLGDEELEQLQTALFQSTSC